MKIQLFHGDCLDVMRQLPNGSVDAIICDPPFGITRAKWDQEIDLPLLWAEYLRVTKIHGVIVLNASQPFTSKLILSQPDLFRFVYYWQKSQVTNFLRSQSQPLRVIEEICVFAKTARYTYNPQMTEMPRPVTRGLPTKNSAITDHYRNGVPDGHGMRTYTHAHPRNIIDVPRDHGTEMFMPTQKPIALMEYLVRTFTNEGDVVLDNCSGSCSTGVACVNLNRKFIGIEKKRSHYEIGRQRIYGLPNIEVSENPQVVGAQKTHFIRFSRQQRAIQEAIKKAKSKRLVITKTLIANMVGISRQQISARYSHLFTAEAISEPVSKSAGVSLYGIHRRMAADKVAAE